MIDTPHITQTAAQHAAVIHMVVPRNEMSTVMGPAIGELMAAIAGQGIVPAGPLFAHHLAMSATAFDFELGVPVATPVEAVGRMKPGQLQASTLARTVFRGSYENLPEAWAEFDEWVEAHGHRKGPDLWESYLTGPDSSSDPADWRTELNRPLIG